MATYEISPELRALLQDGSTKTLTDLAFLLGKPKDSVRGMIERGITSGHLENLHKGNGYKVRLIKK